VKVNHWHGSDSKYTNFPKNITAYFGHIRVDKIVLYTAKYKSQKLIDLARGLAQMVESSCFTNVKPSIQTLTPAKLIDLHFITSLNICY
jgi:hypothetical protein